ncbi:ATP-binding protein [Azospira restricta]|uniref:histidine kinase n=1 Tax=Azospira restricta TaxID=404405 RepID=A0A974PX42_9RHOO|nr:ATP-binding protein [Azospira restricta]QRJ63092.1 hypothetical protein IWH25_15265 [Azospira restricta]
MKLPPLKLQLAAFLVLSLAVLWAATWYALARGERDAIEAARAETRGAAHAFAEHARSTIQRIDQILTTLARTWERQPSEFVAEIDAHQQNIGDISIQVAIVDKDGLLVFSNLMASKERVSLADREHIRVHFAAKESRLFISRPVLGRVSGQWSLQFTRPLLRAGAFNGVIVISVSPERFSRFYSTLSLGRQGITTMVRDSGEVMARAPDWKGRIGQVISGSPYLNPEAPLQGNFSRSSVLDGVERLYGYHRLPEHGLTLVTGLALDEILAPVRAQRQLLLGIAGAGSALFVLMAWLLLRGLAARERSAAALRRTTQELQEYRDRLEELVEARTAQLSRTNAELRESNRRLGETQGMLLQSEKMASLGQLAAGVAHEINNPVGFVNSNLDSMHAYFTDLARLLDAYAAGEARDDGPRIAAIKREIDYDFIRADLTQVIAESKEGMERVKKIVRDLKQFSHVGSTEWQLADLHAGLDSTLNIVSHELKYKAEVTREYGALPAVECLPGEINQVFMNLLVNAGQAIEKRGEIRIRTGSDGDTVWVEVADTGCGIPPENLSRIFDPFFTTKPVGQGTGLGLSLSYATIRKHRGRLDVDSAVGRGTTFRITLPQTQPKEEAALTC